VLTASTSTERTVAVVMAALAELPLAVVCFAVARAPDRFAAPRVR